MGGEGGERYSLRIVGSVEFEVAGRVADIRGAARLRGSDPRAASSTSESRSATSQFTAAGGGSTTTSGRAAVCCPRDRPAIDGDGPPLTVVRWQAEV